MPVRIRLRRARVAVARRRGRAEHSPVYARPELTASGRRLRLSHVVLASDLNPHYLEFWPLARRAWREVAGLEPVLVLVAREEDVPAELLEDEQVHLFEPVEGVHTALQAQCVRLVYPGLLPAAGGVLVSDVDLAPLNRRYWHEPLASLDARLFVAYRDVLHARDMIAIAYNAAEPATWRELFDVESLEDARNRLREWSKGSGYEGVRGGAGWFTDQVVLHDTLLPWAERTGRLWVLDDDFTGFRRLDRSDVTRGLTWRQRRLIRAGRYSDFHAPVPHAEHREVNEEVLELAVRAAQRRPLRRREPAPSLITGQGIAERCRYVFRGDALSLNEDGEPEWWFCKTDFLPRFFAELVPEGPFVLFTHDSDKLVDDRYAEQLGRPNLTAWFAANVGLRHPKLFALPLGVANPVWPHGDADAVRAVQRARPEKARLFDVSFRLETSEEARRECLERTGLELDPPLPFPDYLRRLASSYFCVSPRGNGLDTHRTWEALYVGTIPIVTRSVLTDQHPDLPLVVLEDWSEFGSVDFSPELYRRLWGDWDPAALILDRYLERVRAAADGITSPR